MALGVGMDVCADLRSCLGEMAEAVDREFEG